MVNVTSEVKEPQEIVLVRQRLVSISTVYVVDAYKGPDYAVTVTV